jgi:hypothetical protein
MSFLSSVMIERAFKIIIFAVCPNFSTFLCNCFEFFFLKICLIPTITNKTKKKLRISITKTHRKKHFKFFPNFPIFRATFSTFLFHENLIWTITNIKKKSISQIGPAVLKLTNEQHFIFIIPGVMKNL